MDVLSRITELRVSRKWSECQLAEYSGLTQSTISSWYRKNMTPSIASIERICKAFDISLSQFFLESNGQTVTLTDKELELIHAANKLSSKQFDALLHFLNTL